MRLSFPPREPWVAWSVLLLSCSSQFIHIQMWDRPVYQLARPLHLGCLSPPLLPVWMNISSLTPWLSDIHRVRYSGSSGCFWFLNLLLSFLCARRQSISTYASILAGSPNFICFNLLAWLVFWFDPDWYSPSRQKASTNEKENINNPIRK